jgi:hypothetical protein
MGAEMDFVDFLFSIVVRAPNKCGPLGSITRAGQQKLKSIEAPESPCALRGVDANPPFSAMLATERSFLTINP